MSTNAPGYQMPPAMMPGMPENGQQRMAVAITINNTSGEIRPPYPGEEFVLHAARGDKHDTTNS